MQKNEMSSVIPGNQTIPQLDWLAVYWTKNRHQGLCTDSSRP